MAKGKKTSQSVLPEQKRASHHGMAVSEAKPSCEKTKEEKVVVMDRRRVGERRSGQDRRCRNEPVLVERRKLERRTKVPRRRQIDPTTCERDYTEEEIEFMRALDEYKRSSGRMFPTCSEILEVLRKLGYEKRAADGDASQQGTEQTESGQQPATHSSGLLAEIKQE